MKHTLLLVDDEPSVLSGLKRTLHSQRYRILTATDPTTVLGLLEHETVDVLIADNNMPGMNGTALLARVYERHPDCMRILLTGQANLEVAIEAINSGQIFRFLTKPCDPTQLRLAVRKALEQRELLRQARRLLGTVERQNLILDRLEGQHPGITSVETDEDGCMVLDADLAPDIETLLRHAEKAVETARTRRLQPA